jgi:hypothetical protein
MFRKKIVGRVLVAACFFVILSDQRERRIWRAYFTDSSIWRIDCPIEFSPQSAAHIFSGALCFFSLLSWYNQQRTSCPFATGRISGMASQQMVSP